MHIDLRNVLPALAENHLKDVVTFQTMKLAIAATINVASRFRSDVSSNARTRCAFRPSNGKKW